MPLRHQALAEPAAREEVGGVARGQAAQADDHIGARAHLGQRGREAAAILQRAHAVHQRRTARRVADGAGGAGQAVQRARTGHVGAQAAEQRLATGPEHARGGCHCVSQIAGLTIDLRRCRRRPGRELRQAATRRSAVTTGQFQRIACGAGAHAQVIAQQEAKRAGPACSGRVGREKGLGHSHGITQAMCHWAPASDRAWLRSACHRN